MRLALLLALAGCAHRPPAPPSVYDVAALASLASVGLRVSAGLAEDAAACVTLTASAGVVQTGADCLSSGGAVLPEARFDVSGCDALPPAVDLSAVPDLVASALGPVRVLLASAAKDSPCELRHGLDAVAVRLALVAQAVADELTTPDGVVIVPAVPVEVCP